MARGGRRSGKPGAKYPNRSDMRKPDLPKVGPSQVYGESAHLQRAVRDVPITPQSTPAAPAAPPLAGGSAGGQNPAALAASLPDLFAPTERPDEPISHGAPFGAGPGPAPRPHTVSDQIAILSDADPSGELAAMLQFAQSRGL